jgi:hypothetical protein
VVVLVAATAVTAWPTLSVAKAVLLYSHCSRRAAIIALSIASSFKCLIFLYPTCLTSCLVNSPVNSLVSCLVTCLAVFTMAAAVAAAIAAKMAATVAATAVAAIAAALAC